MHLCVGVQLWCYAGALLAEVILEGVSHLKGRCSAIGRNTISADVQVRSAYLKALLHDFSGLPM